MKIYQLVSKPFGRFETYGSLALFLFLFCSNAFSQSLSLFDIDASGFPNIKTKFYACDEKGNQITNLSPSDFELKENGQPRTVTNVSCPAPKPAVPISSVMTIDVSGSMSEGGLNIAQAAASVWVNTLDLKKSECALTSFDSRNYLNQDFTKDRNLLLNAINSLKPQGGTDYDYGLLNPLAGSLQVSKNGKQKRIVVFLTDGMPNRQPDVNAIVADAKAQNCTIYSVVLAMPCPQSLKGISQQTGGLWFENIRTEDDAKNVYQQILFIAQSVDPCTIEWESGITCNGGITNVELRIMNLELEAKASYNAPSSSVAQLKIIPSTIYFKQPEIGVKKDTIVTVTALNHSFNVTDITLSNPAFIITPTNFYLNAGESRDLTLSYISLDSGYNYCRIEFVNDLCPTRYFAGGGYPGKKPKLRTLKLLHPNGGEAFVVGSDTVITWEGVLPDEPVKIEYSTNSGATWLLIARKATGLSYKWRVPKTPSNECLARVTAQEKYEPICSDVQICDQIWMGCNLDVDHYRNGDPIRHCITAAEWQDANANKEGAWCYYDNSDSLGAIYGKLYNWYAVKDPRGLAPEGWHVPTDVEWKELEMCLGMSSAEAENSGWRGTDQGSQLAGRADLWMNGELKNNAKFGASGFTALPGGCRITTGTYNYLGNFGDWWSATAVISPPSDIYALYRNLNYNNSNIWRYTVTKEAGFSVRCVRNK